MVLLVLDELREIEYQEVLIMELEETLLNCELLKVIPVAPPLIFKNLKVPILNQ